MARGQCSHCRDHQLGPKKERTDEIMMNKVMRYGTIPSQQIYMRNSNRESIYITRASYILYVYFKRQGMHGVYV